MSGGVSQGSDGFLIGHGQGLEVVLDGHGAFRRFKNVGLDRPAERERWFTFREERLRAAAREWLEDQGIEATTAPPERG